MGVGREPTNTKLSGLYHGFIGAPIHFCFATFFPQTHNLFSHKTRGKYEAHEKQAQQRFAQPEWRRRLRRCYTAACSSLATVNLLFGSPINGEQQQQHQCERRKLKNLYPTKPCLIVP